MTRYAVDIFRNGNWDSIALFSDEVSLDAMVAFSGEQFNNGNSLTTPAENIAVIDMMTGELLWDWESGTQTNPSAFILEAKSDEAFDAFLQAFTAGDDVKRRDPEDWDYDEFGVDDDCGFDPYLGCYTDDC